MGMPPYTNIVIIPEEHISKYEVPKGDTSYKTIYMTRKEFSFISKKILLQKGKKDKKKKRNKRTNYTTFGSFDISILLSLRRENKINDLLK